MQSFETERIVAAHCKEYSRRQQHLSSIATASSLLMAPLVFFLLRATGIDSVAQFILTWLASAASFLLVLQYREQTTAEMGQAGLLSHGHKREELLRQIDRAISARTKMPWAWPWLVFAPLFLIKLDALATIPIAVSLSICCALAVAWARFIDLPRLLRSRVALSAGRRHVT